MTATCKKTSRLCLRQSTTRSTASRPLPCSSRISNSTAIGWRPPGGTSGWLPPTRPKSWSGKALRFAKRMTLSGGRFGTASSPLPGMRKSPSPSATCLVDRIRAASRPGPGRFAARPPTCCSGARATLHRSRGRVRAAPVLLAVDVGNTNVTFALFDGERLAADWRVTSHRERTADEVAVELRELFDLRGLEFGIVTGVVISSVVPNLNSALLEASRRYLHCEPVMVGPGVKTSVRVRAENPREVGADRIANALAAFSKYGGPVVVIDFGTAVTYDAINAEGDYLGGAISPGIEISLDALVSQTAMLRRVEAVAPDSVIGRNTVASIQSGLVWGFVAQVEGMVRRMVDELGGTARVVATGGQAALVAGLTHVIESTDPLLTLDGLRLIYAQNSDGGAR